MGSNMSKLDLNLSSQKHNPDFKVEHLPLTSHVKKKKNLLKKEGFISEKDTLVFFLEILKKKLV